MKKVMFLLAFIGFTIGANAQDYEIPVKKSVITNSFWSNWYVSGGVDFNAAYTSEETLSNKNPFSSDRGTFGLNLSVGKWFTPVVGLRTKFQGFWSKKVMSSDVHHSYKYWNLHEDFMVNLSNFFCGYKENRVWNLVPYIGLGVARNMSENVNELSFSSGLLNNFRISQNVSLFFDLSYSSMDGAFDAAENDRWVSYGKFAMRHSDKMLGFSLGVTYNIGKSKWAKAPDIDALLEMNREQLDAMNSSLQDQQEENARLRKLLSKEETPKNPVNKLELVSTSHSVFFNLGSSKVANRKDLIDLKEIAAFAKQYSKQVLVFGYADSKTGSVERNQKLSEDRANVIAKELINMGVAEDMIVIEAKGGVDDIAPFSYNRRVIVKLR